MSQIRFATWRVWFRVNEQLVAELVEHISENWSVKALSSNNNVCSLWHRMQSIKEWHRRLAEFQNSLAENF